MYKSPSAKSARKRAATSPTMLRMVFIASAFSASVVLLQSVFTLLP
jgi:hypothetical protein